jgi:deoxyribodipyrimidine photo-lyase
VADRVDIAIVLFTRDLRVHDQPALAAAARESRVLLPLFVLDEKLLSGESGTPNRVAFLIDSLRDLDASLRARAGRLIVRRGDVAEQTMRLAEDAGAQAVYMSADVSAYARQRERRLRERCATRRIEVHAFEGVTVVAPGEVVPAGSDHYRVFTPYWRSWRNVPRRAPERAPRSIALPSRVKLGRIPAPASLVPGVPSSGLPRGGESVGRRLLQRWLRAGLSGYERAHDDLAGDATSRLSPYLHFGCLSAGEILTRIENLDADAGAGSDPREAQAREDFVRQLCWRDFYHQVLAVTPDFPRADYRPRGGRWRRDDAFARAWREGLTGLPIVDAGMRQLRLEGFMHNRARLITASFFTKTARLDWRIGARHFAELLVDCDLACNVGNWQWVAGTGNDTRPNRVLNPLRQAYRFDPRGEYVRRYVPELSCIEGPAAHEPWLLSATERKRCGGYPDPLVALPARR